MRKLFYSLAIVLGILLTSFVIQESYGQIESIPDEPFKDRLMPHEVRFMFYAILIVIAIGVSLGIGLIFHWKSKKPNL